jgi:elongation factor 4
VKSGDRIVSAHSGLSYEVSDLGIMHPEPVSRLKLGTGQVGFLVLNMKSTRDAHIGDTFYHASTPFSAIQVLPGFRPAKSMVFSGLFPVDTNDYPHFSEAIDRLTLNDASVTVTKETSTALGQGFRLGFLGTLHADVFRERMEEEYQANVINTLPTVPYRIRYKTGEDVFIRNPAEFPDLSQHDKVAAFFEPFVLGTMIFPAEYLGPLMELCGNRRGEQIDYSYLDDERVMMKYRLPMAEALTDFYDQLKSRSSGYASFDYEEAGYAESDLVKVNILLNGKAVDALSSVVHRSQALPVAKDWVRKLSRVIDRQLFDIAIQASVENKIVARESCVFLY